MNTTRAQRSPASNALTQACLNTALTLRRLGFSPLPPLEDGTKAPLADIPVEEHGRTKWTWKPYQQTPATEDHIRRWYEHDRTGVGALGGLGGLEPFEFDCYVTYERFLTAAAAVGLGDLVERVMEGYEEVTPGGGVHWLYTCDAVNPPAKLARAFKAESEFTDDDRKAVKLAAEKGKEHKPIKTLIETKGQGGFIILAPSNGEVHPTRGTYELRRGSLDSIARITPEERDQLWHLAQTFDELPPAKVMAEPKPSARAKNDGSIRPGDDFEVRADWSDILEPFGWKAVHQSGGDTYWRRPGKDHGWSACTGHTKGFKVFTTSTSFSTECTYSKFGAHTHLNHQGDWKASVKALVERGYGTWIDDNGEEHQNPRPKFREPKPPTNGPKPEDKPADTRPEIIATHEEHDVNDLAIKALAGELSIYQRNLKLVSVVFNSKSKSGSKTKIERPEGTPVIRAIQSPRLREVLSKIARWQKWVKNRKGDFELGSAHPPDWSVNAIMVREDWPDVRYLAGVVEVPTLRADGSVIEKPGYDSATGLLYVPSGKFPAVPERPTLDDAKAAAAILFDLVKDFPFKVKDKVSHKVAWLAALLTVLARFLIDGPTPIFLFEANTSGAGKTFLADLIAIIATGRHMTRTGYYHDSIEMDKQIVATCLAGDLVVLFDNIDNGGNFGNSAIDRATTGRTYRGRILGKSEMTPDLDLNAVFFCSGNNIALCGDVPRRIIPCRLESDLERPEERNDFTVKDLAGYTLKHRGELVCAALTFLKAFILVRRPDQGMVPMDFPAWSGLIRNAVKWVTGDDPAIGRKDLTESDPERQHCAAFVDGWYEVQEAKQSKGMTSADMLKFVKDDTAGLFDGIRNAMGQLWPKIKDGELPSSGAIGMKIQAIRGKVFGDKRFELAGEEKRAKIWKAVVIPKPGESSESSESIPNPRMENITRQV